MPPHVPGQGEGGTGLEAGKGGTPTNTNMKAPLKNTDLVGAPSFHHKNRSE